MSERPDVFNNPVKFTNTVQISDWDNVTPAIPRSHLALDNLKAFRVPLTELRVHDAMQTLLPAAGVNDDLGLVGGTFGSGTPSAQTSDLKAAGATTQYARFQCPLPAEYADGETVVLRLHAGMLTTVADGSATIDIEAYLSDDEAGVSGADLCATAAQSINSLSVADKDFTITSGALSAGDTLDVRIAVTITDTATGTEVKGILGSIDRLCDCRG